jgi:multidrug efflux pump subunit AcrA (membrane-fusion protein)
MRQIILSILGLAFIALSFVGMRKIMASREVPKPRFEAKVNKVFTQEVQNGAVAVQVGLNGRLEAVDRVELFSEVQGLFKSNKPFRPGTRYSQGEVIIRVDNSQEFATLKAQRASLENQIANFLPDLKFDYPESFPQWETYLKEFDVNQTTSEFPEPLNERERFFIAGQNITTLYYNIKNLETRLSKYTIRAPFSGVLTESLVQPGALINPGQKLGTFVGQGRFEVALPIREEYSNLLKIGSKIMVTSNETGEQYEGSLIRINPAVDPSSQSVTGYVRISGKNLREGMFFSASLPLQPIQDALEIDRRLLINNKYVFAVRDSALVAVDVEPVHYNQETVVIKGLEDGETILRRPLPGARENLKVEPTK